MESNIGIESPVKMRNVKTSLLYLSLFYLVWTLKELWFIKYIYSLDEAESALLNGLLKILVWVVPAWVYIKYELHRNPIAYLKMNVNGKKGLIWGIAISLLFGLRFAFETFFLNSQTFHFTLPIDTYTEDFLLAGITEEIVFRGLILQELNKRFVFWQANAITALLFLLIHYPIWIYNGDFFVLWSHIYVFLLGLLFGFVYKKTGSLWSVVVLHSFHNFFVMIM